MEKQVKIFRNYDDYKLYKIGKYLDKYVVERLEGASLLHFSDDWEKIGDSDSFEDAIDLAKDDALNYGTIVKVEVN